MRSTPIAIEHARVETNGITLHVAQAGPADGDLVILLHGFPEFWYGWSSQISFLAAQGYRVWAPDQRGYNLSDKPNGIDAYRTSDTDRGRDRLDRRGRGGSAFISSGTTGARRSRGALPSLTRSASRSW